MIESKDRDARVDLGAREAPVRSRRRKSARWKSGLMLTGLGAVVLGAGYLAGVNAPAVDARASAGTATSSGAIAQSGAARPDVNQNQFLVPQNRNNSDDGQVFEFNGDDDGRLFGNQTLPGDNGTFQFNGDGSGSIGQLNQQFGQRSGGRRSRQFGGLSQQQPNFGGPVTRSRGS